MTVYVYNEISKLSIFGIVLILFGTIAFTVPVYSLPVGSFTIFEGSQLCNTPLGLLTQGAENIFGSNSNIGDTCNEAKNLIRLAYFFVIVGFLFLVYSSKKIKEA